jgi:3-hydroxyacyl-[acyl-carrier-protein] dehydratase
VTTEDERPIRVEYDEIRAILPQQPPMIYVDRVLSLVPGVEIRCLKNVSGSEWFFQGHFPGFAVMPGAVVVEGIAQASILLFVLSRRSEVVDEPPAQVFLFSGARLSFLRPIVPGDQIVYHVRPQKIISTGGVVRAEVRVNSEIAVEASLTFAVTTRERLLQPRPVRVS